MELKSSTALVRASYSQCMSACFHGSTMQLASQLVGVLQKSVDRAIAQPTQPAVVTEGLCAACFLVKLASTQGNKESCVQNICSVLFDMDKQLFVSEKFLAAASDDGKYSPHSLCL